MAMMLAALAGAIVLVGSGAAPAQARSGYLQALVQNRQYSLSVLTAPAMGVQRLAGVPGRDSVVVFAAAAETQDEVNFVASAANMLARYHEAVTPVARVSAPGPILGHTAAGALALPAPVDYVSWIEPLGRAVARPELQAPEKVAFLSGQMSQSRGAAGRPRRQARRRAIGHRAHRDPDRRWPPGW